MADEIEQLLYHEAYLLDSCQFRAWLELLAPDVRYWAPVRAELQLEQEQSSEASRLPLFDETKSSLTLRIDRLATGLAWIENPTTRSRRFISNVHSANDADGLVRVRSYFLLLRSRGFSDETMVMGCREDRWSRRDTWLLCERKILIDHCRVENLSLLI
jgi:3-phenylpropionate/cinnamic acid dioxygenase small subunit